MAKSVLIEEFHITLTGPSKLTAVEQVAIRGTINSTGFRWRLRSAMRDLVKQYASLEKVRVTITR